MGRYAGHIPVREREGVRGTAELLELADALCEVDRAWRIVRANRNLERVLGKPRADTLGRVFWDVWPVTADPTGGYRRELHRAMHERIPVQVEGYLPPPRDLWTSIKAYPVSAGGMALFFRDITADRKRHEAERAVLAGVAQDFARLSTEEEITRALGARLAEYLGVSTCTVADFADGMATIRTAFSRPGAVVGAGRLRVSEYLNEELQVAARAGQPIVISDTHTDPRVSAERYNEMGVRAGVIVPFQRGGEWVHSFAVGSGGPRQWRDDEIQLLQEVAGRYFPRIERARAEEALRESEARARSIAENVRDHLVVIGAVRDASGAVTGWRYVDANGGALELLGRRREEVIGRNIAEVLPDRGVAVGERLARVLSTGEPEHYERAFAGRTLLIKLFRIGSERVGSAAIDITDRKHAEEALRESEARLRGMFEDAAVGIVELDEADRFVAVNGRFCLMLGYRCEELLGRSVYEITAPEDRDVTRDLYARGHAGELRVFDYEKRYVKRDGSSVWVHVTVSVVRDAAGRFLRAVGTVEDIADRKRVEEEVHTLAQFPRENPNPVLRASIDGRVLYTNGPARRALESLGWSEGSALPAPLLDAVRQVPHRGTIQSHEVSGAGGQVWSFTLSASTGERHVNLYGRDITASRRAQDELRESEQRFRLLSDAMPQLVCMLAPDRQAEYVNPGWTTFSGLDLAATRRAGWEGVLHPDDLPAARECWRGVKASLAPRDVELRYRGADGGFRWFLCRLAPVVEAGRIVRLIGAALDIDDRRRADAALRSSEERLREYADVLEHASVLVRDAEDRIVTWSRGMEHLYGWPSEVALGKASHELFQTRFPAPLEEIRGQLDRDGSWQGELRHRRADGAELFVMSRWFARRDSKGALRSVIEVNTDVTDLHRAREAIRDANEKLREADRRKDEFLGMLSHELRNPLAPIRNSLYILDRTGATGPQAVRAREVANRQVAHMTRLVDDLLDVTRIARGKIELRRADLDLAALARRTADDHRTIMQDRHLDLDVRVPGAPIIVHGDETRIAQVIGNLLHNAAKFTPEGGRVTLGVGVEGDKAAVRVRDTGAGIAPDVLPTIFEPFTQAKQTIARSEGGLGLGLALVKGLISLHGGDVQAHSAGEGHGAEFVVTLPHTTSRTAASHPPAPAPTTVHRPRHVLVIDDNHDAAETLGELVEMLGHRVAVVYNAYDALEKASEDLPDVVLCDIGLPGMDGYEAARQFRALEGLHRIRLVALSGYAQPEDVAKAMEAGFDAHVAKPPNPERLAELLS